MTTDDAFRKVDNYIADNLFGNWDNLHIRLDGITYRIFLGYGYGDFGEWALKASLSIPDYETAIKMKIKDYQLFDSINERLKHIDYEHYF